MASKDERIAELEEELRTTKYNKATQHHIGLVKAKLARLKEEEQKKSASRKKGTGYSVRKIGDGTVAMIGFPSVGKSTLLNALTNADSKVGAYDFTTMDVIPGVLEYNDAKIQVLDVPGVLHGAASGRGRGREVLSVLRSADLILIVLDVDHPGHLRIIRRELHEANIRINAARPDIRITRKTRGGTTIASTVRQPHVDSTTLEAVLRELGVLNADVVLRSVVTVDEFIDAVEGNRVYIPCLTVLNKIDAAPPQKLQQVTASVRADVGVSAKEGTNMEMLKAAIFRKLDLVRIYLKQAGKKPDLEKPLILRQGCTVEDVCSRLHRDFVAGFKFARCWGPSAKFPGQRKMLHHTLADKDVLEIHLG